MEKFSRESNQAGEMVKVYKEAIKNSQNSNLETLSLLLGNLYLEEGNPQETIQVIEKNTDSPKTIIPSLILADAYKRQQDQNNSQKSVENASCPPAVPAMRALFSFCSSLSIAFCARTAFCCGKLSLDSAGKRR